MVFFKVYKRGWLTFLDMLVWDFFYFLVDKIVATPFIGVSQYSSIRISSGVYCGNGKKEEFKQKLLNLFLNLNSSANLEGVN